MMESDTSTYIADDTHNMPKPCIPSIDYMLISDNIESINKLWRNFIYYFIESNGLFNDPIKMFDVANEKISKINELNNIIINIKNWRSFKLSNAKIIRDEGKILFSSNEQMGEIKKLISCGLYAHSYDGKMEIGYYDPVKSKLLSDQDDFLINDRRHYGCWQIV